MQTVTTANRYEITVLDEPFGKVSIRITALDDQGLPMARTTLGWINVGTVMDFRDVLDEYLRRLAQKEVEVA